ncbi:MAG: AI-2E family transporter [Chloroflexaceae bacterium]|jgi:predicted PurR-regulated permease PerM|nr:AI-2E family transporter [Chloroflexaceae bacterium]
MATEKERYLPKLPTISPDRSAGTGLERAWRISLIAAGGLALALGSLALLWLFARPLALVLIAIVLGEALRPIVNGLSRILPRALAVVLTYLLVVVGLGAAVWFALSPLIEQVQDLIFQLPQIGFEVGLWLQQQDERFDAIPIISTLVNQVQQLGGQLVGLPLTLVSSLLEIVLVGFLSLYWLLSSPGLHRFALSLFPPERHSEVASVLHEMGRNVGGYVRGVAFNIVIIGLLTYLGLLWIGLPFPLVFGVIAGLFEIIPIVGPIMGGTIIVLFALTQSWTTALITLAFVLVLQQIEGNILTPWVMRSQTEIDPLLVLVALLIGGSVGGLLGAIVAIPLAAALRVLIKRVVAPAVRRWSGAPEPEPE